MGQPALPAGAAIDAARAPELLVGSDSAMERIIADVGTAERSIDVAVFGLRPSGTGNARGSLSSSRAFSTMSRKESPKPGGATNRPSTSNSSERTTVPKSGLFPASMRRGISWKYSRPSGASASSSRR